MLRRGGDLTICTYGTLVNQVLDAAELLHAGKIEAEVIKLTCVKPLEDSYLQSALSTGRLLVVEETCTHGGIFDQLAADPRLTYVRKQGLDLGPGFVTHGSVEQLYDHVGLSGVRIAEAARNLVRNEDD